MKKIILTAAIVMALPAAASANYYCAGNVANLMLSSDGGLTASIGTITSVYLCNVSSTYNGVTASTCKAIHAQLLGATLTGRQVRMYFNDNLTCTTHPSWTNLTGWYSGPEFVQ